MSNEFNLLRVDQIQSLSYIHKAETENGNDISNLSEYKQFACSQL
jgi:hypothetical protein